MEHSTQGCGNRRGARFLLALTSALAVVAIGQTAYAADNATLSARDSAIARATDTAYAGLQNRAQGRVLLARHRATQAARIARIEGEGDLQPGGVYASRHAKVDAFLAQHRALFGAQDEHVSLALLDQAVDTRGGATLSYQQTYRGVRVFGAMLRANVDARGRLRAVNGMMVPALHQDLAGRITPSVNSARAGRLARDIVRQQLAPSAGKLASDASLIIYRVGLLRGHSGPARLAWEITVNNAANSVREFVYLDAHTGKALNQISGVHELIQREIYDGGFNSASSVWSEGDSVPVGNPTIDDLIDFSLDTYNVYSSMSDGTYLSFDGVDGIMHAVNNDPTIACPNAHWTGSYIGFCPELATDDIVAHEWAHGYTERTHGLIYQYQSGALNESYSDIFGELMDQLNGAAGDTPNAPRNAGACSVFGGGLPPTFTVDTPAAIAGPYTVGGAAFNPSAGSVSGQVAIAFDITGTDSLACNPLPANSLDGMVALIDRGDCAFSDKALNAQVAGATGAIVINNDGDDVIEMGGSNNAITIPSVFVGQSDGALIRANVGSASVSMALIPGTDNSVRWLLGEDAGAIRDMWSPNCFGNPAHVSDDAYFCGEDDGGGVHSNSGIPNHGFALLVDGGTHNAINVPAIGANKAAHIYWRAQHAYQTPSSGFAEHADALEAACADLAASGGELSSVSTDTGLGLLSGDIVDASDCAAVAAMIQAIELRAAPIQCGFEPLLQAAAPAPCGDGEQVQSTLLADFEAGLGDWSVGTREIARPFTFDTENWATTNDLPEGRSGTSAHVEPFLGGNCRGDLEAGVTYLQSPDINLGDDTRLAFDHWVATEREFDGGNIKISVNGGNWSLIPASAFIFNAYNLTFPDSDNPLTGESAFSGANAGTFQGSWGQSQIDLTGLASSGDTIALRFEMGVDGCNASGQGWFVDDVHVYACANVAADDDADNVADNIDNCLGLSNPAQRDTDNDGLGNACDSDLDNDCTVNFADLAIMKAAFFSNDALSDLDGDGTVNFSDLSIMKTGFFAAPGPSALPNTCDNN